MKIKTSELVGAALDWVVSMCERRSYVHEFTDYAPDGRMYQRGTTQDTGPHYSTDWAQGGPIIERESICVARITRTYWVASPKRESMDGFLGSTPLIAAMRCYVTSELGDEVDVPEELYK